MRNPTTATAAHPCVDFSVLMPVYLADRPPDVLRRVLTAWERVAPSPGGFELILACDGPDPRVAELVRGRPLPIRVLEAEHAGQSAATNLAAAAARGERLLFSAQDIVPDPDLLAAHARAHAAHPGAVALGYLPYPRELAVTPFMEFIVEGGPQFAYYLLTDGEEAAPQFLYAPNFSLDRALFERHGGFREDLPYACQDSEYGLRLRAAGVRMIYHADAVGLHWHPQDLDGYTARQYLAGRNTVKLADLHPLYAKLDGLRTQCLAYYVGQTELMESLRGRALRIEVLSPAERRRQRVSVRTGVYGGWIELDALQYLYDRITKFHFFRGVHDALVERDGRDWLTASFYPWVIDSPRVPPRFFVAPASEPARSEPRPGVAVGTPC